MKVAKLQNQKGFTLIEIAVVLTIIGLLMAAVVKGGEFIKEAKYDNIKNAVEGYKVAFNSYMKKYSAVPGDDDQVINHTPSAVWSSATAGDGSGAIDTVAEEAQAFDHLARAGLIKSFDGIGTAYPKHALGGPIKMISGVAGFTHAVCLDGLSKDDAVRMDEIFDGSLSPDTGDAHILDSTGNVVTDPANISATGNEVCVAL